MTGVQRIVRFLAFIGLAVGGISCDDATAPRTSAAVRPDVRRLVTAEVLALLDSDGHFVFPEVPGANGWRVAPASAASATATAYAGLLRAQCAGAVPTSFTAGGILLVSQCTAVEQLHGARVRWSELTVAPWPPYYARSPVMAVSDSYPEGFRRSIGPRYHMFLTDGVDVVADVAVSTDLSGVALTDGRWPYFAALPSGVFRTEGLSVGIRDRLPLVPEVAVSDVARRTGAMVAALPELLEPWDQLGSVFARWRLRLDRDVVVTRDDTNERIATRELLVGLGPSNGGGFALTWFVPAREQPASESWPFIWSTTGRRDSITFRFVSGTPVKMHRVHPDAGACAGR